MPLLPGAEQWREHFPIFRTQTYINSCSQGALSREVRAAYDDYLTDWDALGSPWELWVERAEATRSAFASLIGAAPDEVAVMTSVSAAVSALASSLDYSGARDTIVVSDFEFPGVAQIWHAQAQRGARIVHVPVSGTSIPLEAFEQAIDERTLLVAASHVSFRSGARQDPAALAQLAHRHGALLLVDSYQALGALPIDVRASGADFVVGGTLKYLLASAGLAFLYARADLIPALRPTALGWFSQANIFAMDIYQNQPAPNARRFESGTPPVPNIYAGLAGMQIIQQLGVAAIEAHVRELNDQLIAGALQLGCSLATPLPPEQRGPMVAIRSNDVGALVRRMAERAVVVSSRDNNLRISTHFYNNQADIERVLAALGENRDLLG